MGNNGNIHRRRWTEVESKTLIRLINDPCNFSFEEVAQLPLFRGRTPNALRMRFYRLTGHGQHLTERDQPGASKVGKRPIDRLCGFLKTLLNRGREWINI